MNQDKELLELKENTTGVANEGFVKGNGINSAQSSDDKLKIPMELPPLTYKDFIPDCIGSIAGKAQSYAEFGSVVEQANKWLLTVPQFTVFRCETVVVKLDTNQEPNNDLALQHFSSNGKNFLLRILRVWLIPKIDSSVPVQQLSYITVLPEHDGTDLTRFLSSLSGAATSRSVGDIITSFDSLKTTVDKLNNFLSIRPLQGKILSFETLTFKCHEAETLDKFDAESSWWCEVGSNTKVYVHGFRIFYIKGQPAHETIGIHDIEPTMTQSSDGLGLGVKFSSFNHTLSKASQWIQEQENIQVVSIQNVDIKLDRKQSSGPWTLSSSVPGYTESQSLAESRFTKVLRIAYIKDIPSSPHIYSSINLTSKIFIPARTEGRRFETFSKTILRLIDWLQVVRVPVFMCETLSYHVSTNSSKQGFNDQRPDYLVNTYYGQHYLTCIRLYFLSAFQDIQQSHKSHKHEHSGGQSCNIS